MAPIALERWPRGVTELSVVENPTADRSILVRVTEYAERR